MIGSEDFTLDVIPTVARNRFVFSGRKRESDRKAADPRDRFHCVRAPLSSCVLLLLAVAAGSLGLTGCAKKEPPVAVPDVRQQDPDQAQKTLVASKLKTGNITGGSGAGAYVASQSPAAGQQVAPNSTVDLVVEMPVTVPVLAGSNVTDAVTALQGLGLKVAFREHSSINPFGKTKVEQQDPAANSSVHRDSTVTLIVSRPQDISALLGMVAKEPAYQNLKPEYKKALDAFLGNPSTPRGMDSPSVPSSPSTPTQ